MGRTGGGAIPREDAAFEQHRIRSRLALTRHYRSHFDDFKALEVPLCERVDQYTCFYFLMAAFSGVIDEVTSLYGDIDPVDVDGHGLKCR
jgi:hypothetical protein